MRIFARWLMPAVLASVLLAAVSALSVAPAFGSECPNEQVRSESNVNPSTGEPYDLGLPECRAYEKTSPDNKSGLDVGMAGGFSADGVVSFDSTGIFAGAEGGTGFFFANPYMAFRSTSGWLTHPQYTPASIAPLPLTGTGNMTTPDLSRKATCGEVGAGASSLEAAVVCAVQKPDGSWAVSPRFPDASNVHFEEEGTNRIGISAASNDLSHLFFIMDYGRLLESDTVNKSLRGNFCSGSGIYELAGLGTESPVTLQLVNVDNNGVQIGTTMPQIGNTCGNAGGSAYHAVSEDGETIYFEATPTGGVQTLYARLDGSHTVTISEPSVADCAECQTAASIQKPAIFQGASADGSKVFFTTEQELLPGRRSNNLYEYEVNAPVGHKVTAVTPQSSKAEVQGVLRNSGDGSHVYFVAKSALTTEPNRAGQEAMLGADNLYVYERDNAYPSGHTAFIAMLCSAENLSGVVEDSQCPGASTNDTPLWQELEEGTEPHKVQVTRNGVYMVFQTYAHLSPEDKNSAQAIYRYDATTGELSWVSHGAAGFKAQCEAAHPGQVEKEKCEAEGMPAEISSIGGAASTEPAVEELSRAISENGEDVIFTTNEALQADDSNKGIDVYLWHDGTVSMISDGHGELTGLVAFMGTVMSPSGSDIYFTTREHLVGQDIDENTDIYDARVDGGFPAPSPPPLECGVQDEGEVCQGGLSTLPLLANPGSVTFTGGVNVVPGLEGKKSTPRTFKPLTRAQKLAAALKACRKQPKKKRAACESRARSRYGAKSKTKVKKKSALKAKKSIRRGN